MPLCATTVISEVQGKLDQAIEIDTPALVQSRLTKFDYVLPPV